MGAIYLLIGLGMMVLWCASEWKVFAKAGLAGWEGIVPVYNLCVTLVIAEKPIWWLILFLIPFVNVVVSILTYAAFVAKFGKGIGFAFGLVFLSIIFWPILAFGDARYSGAAPSM